MPTDAEKRVLSIIPVSSGTTVDMSNDEFFTIQEIAARWKLSPDKIRRIFAREKGVLVIPSENSRGNKRGYLTLRIPRDVLLRVERKHSLMA